MACFLVNGSKFEMNYPATKNDSFYSAISFRQKGIAEAHIRAVCASLGCSVSVPDPDDDKLDFTISSKVEGKFCSKPKLDVQSKCQLSDDPVPPTKSHVSYTIDLDLYDNLRDKRVAAPRILVVTLVPRKPSHWIDYSHATTKLSFCSYWVSLRDLPELPKGQKSKTLNIPKENIFCADFLDKAMRHIADGEGSFLSGIM